MKILFINSHYYMPQSFGGLSVTLHQLCRALQHRGHEIFVLAGFRKGGSFAARTSFAMNLRALAGRPKLGSDDICGYRIWRSWEPVAAIPDVCAMVKPDIVIIMGGKVVPAVNSLKNSGYPVLVQVHDVETEFHGGDYREIYNYPVIANSDFTRIFYSENFGSSPKVIYPYIEKDKYFVDHIGNCITFINPYVHKGLKVAIAVAQICQELQFLFVGHVSDGGDENGSWADQLARLTNVRCVAPVSDMTTIYSQTRILFAPSQWREAYGRVAAEAQISGIPVIGSNQGGLPEAIGNGGIVLSADAPREAWAETLRLLWNNSDIYQRLRQAAFAESRRRDNGLDELECTMRELVSCD